MTGIEIELIQADARLCKRRLSAIELAQNRIGAPNGLLDFHWHQLTSSLIRTPSDTAEYLFFTMYIIAIYTSSVKVSLQN